MPIFKTGEPVKNYRASPWKITTLLYYCLRFHYIWPSASILLLEALCDIKGLIKQLKNPFQPMWHSSGLSSREWESKSRQDNTKNEIAFHFGYKDKSEIFCSIVLHSCVFAYRKEEKKVKRRSYYVCKSPVQKCKYWNWVLTIVLRNAVINLEGEMHQFQKQFPVVKKQKMKAFK